jgi:hypothetical protein
VNPAPRLEGVNTTRQRIPNSQELKNGVFEVVLTVSGGAFTAITKAQLTDKMQERYGRHIEVLDWQQTRTEMRVLVKAGNPTQGKEKEAYSVEALPLIVLTALALIGLFALWKITVTVKETVQLIEKTSQTTAGTVAAFGVAAGSVLVPIAVVAVVWLLTRSSRKGET